MKKCIAVLAAVLLFTGCASESANFGAVDTDPRTVISVSVQSSLGNEVKEAVRLFARKAYTISGNSLIINLYYEENPYESLMAGEVDLIYVRSEDMEQYDRNFAIYSSPFFFHSYEQAAMALGSETFDRLTRDGFAEDLGVHKLGAVFGGARVMLSSDRYIVDGSDLVGLTVGLDYDPWLHYVIEQMEGEPVLLGDEVRYDDYFRGDINTVDLPLSDLAEVGVGGKDRAFLTQTYHTTYVEWMFISTEKYEELTPLQLAAIKEGMAYLTATLENNRLESYREDLARQETLGMQVTTRTDLENIRRSARDILYRAPEFSRNTDWDFYDAVSAIVR